MPPETLEHWVPRVAAALERVEALPARELAASVAPMEQSARARAPRRIRDRILARLEPGRVRLVADHPAAAAFENGGRIHGSPFLAIPLREDVRGAGDSPLAGPRLFKLVLRDGREFLASREGGSLDIRWRLLRSVAAKHQPSILPAGAEVAATLPGRVEADIRRELA